MKKLFVMSVIGLLSLSSFAAKPIEKEFVTDVWCHYTIYYSDGSTIEHIWKTSYLECKVFGLLNDF